MRAYIITFFLICGILLSAKAQKPDTIKYKNKTDSVYRKKDSVTSKRFVPKVTKEVVYHPDSTHSPHKAVMHSLMVPGWGQIYNHQYWKVPLIYGGLAAFAYYIVLNNQDYVNYLAVAKFQESGLSVNDPSLANDPKLYLYKLYGGYPKQSVIDVKDGSRRNRDLSILGFLGLWGINMVDAYIDAKFQHSFSMDNNFGVKVSGGFITPPYYASNFNTFTPAIKLTLTLK